MVCGSWSALVPEESINRCVAACTEHGLRAEAHCLSNAQSADDVVRCMTHPNRTRIEMGIAVRSH